MKLVVMVASVLALSACSKPADTASDQSADASATAAAPAAGDPVKTALVQCLVCHKIAAGEPNSLGPNLHGIVGRKAGSVEGFAYSSAMKDSGKIWDEATLDAFIEKPMTVIPGSRMAFAGVSDPVKRKAVVDALKTLK